MRRPDGRPAAVRLKRRGAAENSGENGIAGRVCGRCVPRPGDDSYPSSAGVTPNKGEWRQTKSATFKLFFVKHNAVQLKLLVKVWF